MATNGISPDFRIPHESLPVPNIAYDEKPVPFVDSDESFVVLGKSLVITDFEDLSFDEEHNNLGTSIIQEAKQLINDELDKIEHSPVEEHPVQENVNGIPENTVTIATQNGYGPSSSRSAFQSTNSSGMDESAVWPAMPQPQLHPCSEMEDNISRAISIISFAPSEFASEELQAKVSQLIDENVHLKDTIMQNNMSMKAQYEKIVAWQKDVEKVHEAHKEKFRQAKQYIESLKKENVCIKQECSLLQQEVENLRYSLKQQESEHDKTKQILTQSSENNLTEFELDIANKRVKELEEVIQKMNTKANDEVVIGKSNWQAMEEKLARYEKELEEAYKEKRNLEKNSSHDNLLSRMEKLKANQEKLQLTETAYDQANQEIRSLRSQLARQAQATGATSKMLSDLQEAKNNIKELEELLTSRNASLMDANMRLNKAEDHLLQANEKIKVMEASMATLQGQLEETKIEVWKNKQKLIDRETQLQMAQKDLETSQHQKPTINYDEVAYLRQQLMQSQIAMTQCDQSRAVAYAQLETQKNDIVELRRQLDTKQNETDAMFALHTQLEVYKTDFEAEREAKEEVKRDKNKLSEDLQHLHRRNQQLQEETELLRGQLKEYGGAPNARHQAGNSGQGATGWSTNRENRPLYKCPKCGFGFTTLNAVENHVNRCIELDDSLP